MNTQPHTPERPQPGDPAQGHVSTTLLKTPQAESAEKS